MNSNESESLNFFLVFKPEIFLYDRIYVFDNNENVAFIKVLQS